MTKKGINSKGIKVSNKSLILSLLYFHGGMSRKEIAQISGLTPASVTQQVNEMISQDIISELFQQKSTNGGPREIIVDIKREQFVCIGVDVSIYGCKLCIMDFNGKMLLEEEFDTISDVPAERFIEHLCGVLNPGINTCKELSKNLVGVGISLRGIVNGKEGIWIDTYGLVKEDNIQIKEMLEQKLNIPVIVDDNVRAMANAEALLSGFMSSEGMLFIKYGYGVGAAITINGELYQGHKFRAAEIGHVVVDPNAELCSCGRRGCLEATVSYSAIKKKLIKSYSAESCPKLYEITGGDAEKIDMKLILEAYSHGDEAVCNVLDYCQRNLVMGIHNSISLLAPKKIVLYGEAFDNEKFLSSILKLLYQNNNLFDCKDIIFKSKFNMQLETRGAASLAVKLFLNGLQ